jgi:transposase-like protein
MLFGIWAVAEEQEEVLLKISGMKAERENNNEKGTENETSGEGEMQLRVLQGRQMRLRR